MHQFTQLRTKADLAYGTSCSAASATQVRALLDLAETASQLLDDLSDRAITGAGDSPYPGRSKLAWELGQHLRVNLDRVQHLSEVTR